MQISAGKMIIVGLMGLIPATASFGVYGVVKDRGVGNLGSGAIAALVGGAAGMGVGVAAYYIMGLDKLNGQTEGLGLISARRVGLIEATKKQAFGMILDACPGCKVY